MQRLKKFRKSTVNNITIVYGEETIKFNLWEELQISEEGLEDDLRGQPSLYGFLLSLQKKLTTRFEELKLERKRVYSEAFLNAKNEVLNGRPLNDEMCKASAESNPKFIKLSKQCIKAKDDADTLFAAVKAFEQRKDNLQTLSANRRKEF